VSDPQPILATEEQVKLLAKLMRQIAGLTGPGVTKTPNGIVIAPPPTPPSAPSQSGAPQPTGKWLVATGAFHCGGWYVAQEFVYDFTSIDPFTADTFDGIGALSGPSVALVNEAERGLASHDLTVSGAIGVRHWCQPAGTTITIGGNVYDVWVTDSYTTKSGCAAS
jgi:hypothetical protein